MDHIPLPSSPVHPHPKVPYFILPHHTYDNLSFVTFPSRIGVPATEFNYGNPTLTWTETVSFFQSWLYFGFLISVLGVSGMEIDIADFVVEENGRRLIT